MVRVLATVSDECSLFRRRPRR